MATIKSYTDIEQSQKLIELGLNPDSADMSYSPIMGIDEGRNCGYLDMPDLYPYAKINDESKSLYLPCWSLSALLSVLPNGIVMNKDSQNGKYHFSSNYIGTYVTADSAIDACVSMIEKLHELKML